MGSLTLRIISEESHTSSADGTIFAPTAAYSSSLIAEPTPAPCCTKTSWPWSTRAFTPAGVAATRNSLFLTSVGIPTFMRMSFFLDDSPPTTLSAVLTTVATVTTRVHGCVGTHLFKVALPTEPRKSSLRADHGCRTPRVPDLMILAVSTCDHHPVPVRRCPRITCQLTPNPAGNLMGRKHAG